MIATTEAYGLTFSFPARDTAVGASLRDHGEFARPELDLILELAQAPTGLFLDVGAHVGAMALPFAAARPGWRVIAIEAFIDMAGLLSAAAYANRLQNVEVRAAAAGSARGEAEFPAAELSHAGNFGAIGFYSTECATRRTVPVLPLDELEVSAPCIVKIDVEGYEPQVFSGAQNLIRDYHPDIVFEAHRNHAEQSAEVARMLSTAGYRLYWFFAPFATPLAPKSPAKAPFRGDMNIVALHNGRVAPWGLTEVVDVLDRPTDAAAFPYLQRYGY